MRQAEKRPVDLPTPRWWGIYARDPITDPRSDALLRLISRSQQAVQSEFIPWLKQVRNNSSSPPAVEALLRAMHRIVVDGGYTGSMGNSGGAESLVGGEMLMDSPERMQPSRAAYGLNIDDERFPEMTGWSLDHVPTRETSLSVICLPEQAWPTNELTMVDGRPTLEHRYIPARFHPQLLQRMDALLSQVVRGGRVNDGSVDALAEYYYLGINAQLFPRVNNSVLMSQVNHLLGEAGHPGISHRLLDLEAITRPLSDFRDCFRAAVVSRAPLEGGRAGWDNAP